MKRINKWIISALLLAGTSLSAFGCGAPQNTQNELKNPIDTQVLFDFEGETDLERLDFYYQTGERKLTDERVLQGNRSLEVTVNAVGANAKAFPAMGFSAVTEGISDFNSIDNIGVDVYNPESSDLFVGIKLLDGVNKTLYNEMKYVSPSTVGHLRFVLKELSGESKVASVQFYVYKNGMEETGLNYYIDNITITKGSQNYVKTLTYGEIVSFKEYSDIDSVSVKSANPAFTVVAKSYERNALCLNFTGLVGDFDKTIADLTVADQKVSLAVAEDILEKIDFSGIYTVYADVYNESYTERKVTIWFENGAKRISKTFTLPAGKWQTIKISTDGKQVEKLGFEFNSTDVANGAKTLIRSIRYTL